MKRPRLAITLGDPRGIGPEVVADALRDDEIAASADFVIVGPEVLIADERVVPVGRWSPRDGAAAAGRVAGEAIRAAVGMAMEKSVDAIVTAPIDKAAFHAGGWNYPGHTEMLRELSGSSAVGMMMVSERAGTERDTLRVVLATTHLPLRSVPDALTSALLVEQTRLTDHVLREWWDTPRPRIALCAFNPHASDGGLFGDEEERIYGPALEALSAAGVHALGPIPADTVFGRALRGDFHAVIAPYHDVGMAAFKTVAFGSGVNVTMGLPFPRTSPDHGTALDIAGRGVANAESMKEAIRLAVRLASRSLKDAT
jgi:4-hydroxythreonine-4-phosphate dehydrogenase